MAVRHHTDQYTRWTFAREPDHGAVGHQTPKAAESYNGVSGGSPSSTRP